MKVSEIIKAVRLCVDEEQANFADLTEVSANDNTYMDNIIRAKINDALLWVCQYASADILNSSTTASADGVVSTKVYNKDSEGWETDEENNIAKITLDSIPLRVTRVMGKDWHRGVLEPFSEDSDEFAMMYNETERGTIDLPRVGLVHSVPEVLYMQPIPEEVTVMVVNAPKEQDVAEDTKDVDVPAKAQTSFIYYIAYLLMIAYENFTKAAQCYRVATENLNIQVKNENN